MLSHTNRTETAIPDTKFGACNAISPFLNGFNLFLNKISSAILKLFEMLSIYVNSWKLFTLLRVCLGTRVGQSHDGISVLI